MQGSEGGSICQGNEEVSLLHLLHLLQLFQGSEWVPYCRVVTVIILFQGSEGGGVKHIAVKRRIFDWRPKLFVATSVVVKGK